MSAGPDSTAVRVALWRALHVEADPPPHVLEDVLGLRLADPGEKWRERPDMSPGWTRTFRASIVARARFIEDLVAERIGGGVTQYVLLGAGLDTFVQRRPDLAARVRVFEIDRPGPAAWKRERLAALGLPSPVFVPVDFEAGESWVEKLAEAGFDKARPAVVAATGVTMYLTQEANAAMFSAAAALAPGSVFAATFLRPIELLDPAERPGLEAAMKGAKASGHPFLSFFAPDRIVPFARERGFKDARYVSAEELNAKYFAGRTDGLRTSNGEEMVVATA